MFLLVGILVFAYPALRLRHHNNFEMTHRFMGWAAVGFVWALVRATEVDSLITHETLLPRLRSSFSPTTTGLLRFRSGWHLFIVLIFGWFPSSPVRLSIVQGSYRILIIHFYSIYRSSLDATSQVQGPERSPL